jgi:hypothetical protein
MVITDGDTGHFPTPKNGHFPTPKNGHFPTPKNGHFPTQLPQKLIFSPFLRAN